MTPEMFMAECQKALYFRKGEFTCSGFTATTHDHNGTKHSISYHESGEWTYATASTQAQGTSVEDAEAKWNRAIYTRWYQGVEDFDRSHR